MPTVFVPDVPACGARVKEEGDEYYKRNRDGHMKNYLDQTKNKNFVSPRPRPRTGGNTEAMEQMEKHRGSINNFMDQKKNMNYMSARPPPRCNTPEAKAQYERAKGCMTECLSGHGGHDPRNRSMIQPRGVTPEAQHIAKANKGLGTKKLFTTYGKVTPRPPPMARVKPEAEQNSNNNKGLATKSLFYNYGQQSCPAVRQSKAISDEASEAAKLGQGGRARSLLMMQS